MRKLMIPTAVARDIHFRTLMNKTELSRNHLLKIL
jgi:hypothetical protein